MILGREFTVLKSVNKQLNCTMFIFFMEGIKNAKKCYELFYKQPSLISTFSHYFVSSTDR